MDRKEFLKNSFHNCLACCGAIAGLSSALAGKGVDQAGGLAADLKKRIVTGAESPDWRRAEKSLSWIKNILTHIDEQLDGPSREKLLNACGRSCYLYAEGVADDRPKSPEQKAGFLAYLEKSGFKIERKSDITVIHFGYRGEQNPQGLSLKEGYCLCPIVEKDLSGISPTYCNCSAGYVRELVERNSGLKVRSVEVLESIKRGGKDCRFRLELLNG